MSLGGQARLDPGSFPLLLVVNAYWSPGEHCGLNHCIACAHTRPFRLFFFSRPRGFALPLGVLVLSSCRHPLPLFPLRRHLCDTVPRPTGRAVAGLADDVGATLQLGSLIAYRLPWRHSRYMGSSTGRILKQAVMLTSLLRTNRRLAARAAGGIPGPARTTRAGLPPPRYPALLLFEGCDAHRCRCFWRHPATYDANEKTRLRTGVLATVQRPGGQVPGTAQ